MKQPETQEGQPQASAAVREYSRSRYRAFCEWLGLGKDGEKTGLDLLQVLAAVSIPVAVVIMGAIFTAVQNSSQQQAEEQRAQTQLEVEEQRAQDEVLQAYLEEMGRLLVNKELNSSPEGEGVRTLARARTLTVLERVDNDRKSSVVRFLVESRLIERDGEAGEPIIALNGANLRDTDLAFAPLADADLGAADLRGADLRSAELDNASLVSARLEGADLRQARLLGTDLTDARTSEANLTGAYLDGAVVTEGQLSVAYSPEGAAPPKGLNTGGNGYQPAAGYILVEHISGNLAVEVPSNWRDTDVDKDRSPEGGDVDLGEGIGPAITATTDLEAWSDADRLGVSGVYIAASRELASYTNDELVDSLVAPQSVCEKDTRQDFDRSPYSGRMQWFTCDQNNSDHRRLILAATPKNHDCTVIVQILTHSERDREAARHILDTFDADCRDIFSASADDRARSWRE